MSYTNETIERKPTKYNKTIKSTILDRTLEIKAKQYNALQSDYNELINTSNNNSSWKDIPNKNYMYGMVDTPGQSTPDWKFLGKSNNLNECKLKSVEDNTNQYSNIVYTSKDFQGIFKGTCYGNIKGTYNNPQYTENVTTSLAPNGTSIIGGVKGENLLKQMKNKSNEIENLIKEQNNYNYNTLLKDKSLTEERKTNLNKLELLSKKLKKDRIKINNILQNPINSSSLQDSYQRQLSNYSIYSLWIILVLLSFALAVHLITSDTVSVITYIFVGIWTFILLKYYYNQIKYYGSESWEYISNVLTNN